MATTSGEHRPVERHAAEAALLEAVVRQMPAAVLVAEAPSGRVLLASGRAEAILAAGPDAGPGAPGRPLERTLRTGEVVEGEEVVHLRPDGSEGVYLVSSAPVRDARGGIVAAVAVWVDVTEARGAARSGAERLDSAESARKEAVLARTAAEAAQADAVEADTAKSAFLASMSHEIRTPINAILGYTELMELGLSGPVTDAQHAQLARIRESGRHLLGLVNEVLDLAKIDAGEMTVDRERARLRDAVVAALDMVRPQAAERGLALYDGCEGEPGTVYLGDAGRVRQIAANLLSNAVKFTPPGGRIQVSCGVADHPHGEVFATHAGPWAYLSVEDNGIGVPPGQLARIFEPFVQAEEGHTRRAGGTGLGLTISRRLARLMGGDITVRSHPGEGSTFTLWLPAAGGGAEAPGQDPAPADPEARTGIRGIAGIGMRMLDEVDAVCQKLVRRLRDDPPVEHAGDLPDSAVRNHFAAFVADAVQCLVILEESPDDAADLMKDGSAIQRTIADRHGFQRHRLRWTEEGLHRDYRILMEELEACAREAARDVPEVDLELALSLLRSFVQQAHNVSVRAHRIARRAEEGRG